MTNQEKIEQIKKHFNIKTDPVYSVKNVKSFMGREGHGFEASLYKHGVGEYTCQPASRTKLPTAAYRSLTGDAITTMLGRIKEKRAGAIVFNRLLDDLV